MNTLAKKNRRFASVRPNAAIRLDESIRRDDSLDLKRIVVPVDFSGPSLNALRYAARLAAQSGASIFPLYVAEHVIYLDKPATFPRLNVLEEMKQKLADLVRYEIHELLPVFPQVLTGKPSEAICRAARDHAADLIVIGTHGRTGLQHVMLGSTAERVVRLAPCPVLVVRDVKPGGNKPASRHD
jgi:nucleotide-binding universal stress UspA family protein